METDCLAYSDSWTQTEWTGGWESPPPIGLFPFSQNNLMQSPAILFGHDEHHYETLEEAFGHEEEMLPCELEYEEVTLFRRHCDEKLGLTLCYANPDEPETNIFVSEIEPESLASKDGRIIEGDQLLQVNGIDVRNREQAVSLFSSKEPEIILLLSRPRMQEDEEDEEEDEEHVRLEDISKEFYMLRQRRNIPDMYETKGENETDKNTTNDLTTDWGFISRRLLLPHGTEKIPHSSTLKESYQLVASTSTTTLFDVSPDNNTKKEPSNTRQQTEDDSK